MKKIAIVGLGTAGIQAIAHFLAWSDMEVYSIHDPSINPIGIGESTNPTFVLALEYGANFNIIKDMDKLDATIKFGTEYLRWRENDFTNSLIDSGYAIHMNTFKLRDFALNRFRENWGNKFKEIHANVASVENKKDFVLVKTKNNEEYNFDFVILCTGFSKNKNEYFEPEEMPVNSCLVHNIDVSDEESGGSNYTGHIAMENGWMFRVPLSSRSSYGYLFNDNYSDTEDIKKEMCEYLSIDSKDHQDIVYRFNPYYAKKIVDGRIFKNGNAALFFEPMFANSLWAYDSINRIIFDYIYFLHGEEESNEKFLELAKKIENMIRFHYIGGSTMDTDFWKRNSKKSKEMVENYPFFNEIICYMNKINEEKIFLNSKSWVFSEKYLKIFHDNLEYDYF